LAHKATLRERYRHVLRVRARRRLAPRRPEGMRAQGPSFKSLITSSTSAVNKLDWLERAACRGLPNRVFFPSDRRYRRARAVCAACPVRTLAVADQAPGWLLSCTHFHC
jgi:hypothetical protein